MPRAVTLVDPTRKTPLPWVGENGLMPRSHQLVWQTTAAHRVTTLELFFDLVFVFAITQVTALMANDLGWRGAFRGLVVLALLWWAWCSYAWLGNQARADEGVVRAAMILAMAIMFLVALCIPEAWNDRGGGLNASLVLAVGVAAVRIIHLAVFAVVGAGDPALRRQLGRTALPVGAAGVLLVAGAWVGGTEQTVMWQWPSSSTTSGSTWPEPTGTSPLRRTSPSGTA